MSTTKIEWIDKTWNPASGCTKISEGCDNCYAEKMAARLQAMGCRGYENGFKVTVHPHRLREPLKWKKPCRIFACSMGDLFHRELPDRHIMTIFDVMRQANWHTFYVLTKRIMRLGLFKKTIEWPRNVWGGVTVENRDSVYKIYALKQTDLPLKYISIEPLLGDLGKIDLSGIDWVIVGGETGPGARPMKEEWIVPIFEECQRLNIPFFFKGWGGFNKKKKGRLFLGQEWNELPATAGGDG